MATRLDKTIKRELELDGKLYTVTMSPEGARKGPEVSWREIIRGDANPRPDMSGMGIG